MPCAATDRSIVGTCYRDRVSNYRNRAITGLAQENFRVFEDNIEQEVLTFPTEDAPVSVGLILDVSESIAVKVGEMREAAAQFLKAANPEDEVFAVNFADHA